MLKQVQAASLAIHDASKSTATVVQFTNSNAGQPLQWIVRSVSKEPVAGVVLEINGKPVMDLKDRALAPGGSLRYAGGPEAAMCDATWKELARLPVDDSATRVSTGNQQVRIYCAQQSGASLKVELRALGPAVRIGSAASTPRSSREK